MTVEQRLRQILASSGGTFMVRKGHVEVMTKLAALREMRPTVENPLDDEASEGTPLPPVVPFARFDGETLEAACEKLAERAGVNVAIDPRQKEAAATKVKCRLVNVPLHDALAVLADMAGLAVVRKGNLYYLTSPKNAERLNPPPAVFMPGIGGLGGIIPMTPPADKE